MCRYLVIIAVVGVVLILGGGVRADIMIDTVPVGNPGNPGDVQSVRTFGAVDYTYQMGKYEITAGQYCEFLNAVAASDTYHLYAGVMWSSQYGCKIERSGSPGSYTYSVASDWADRPVNYVSWGDAARFSNWLHNGQPTGPQDLTTTEDGSYYLNGAIGYSHLQAVVREPDATWVIPSEDEWYKTAYHKNNGATGDYFDYPMGSDASPSNELMDPDTGNNATFYLDGLTVGSPYYRTEVGEHENSASPYGTFDQGGNVWEWTDTIRGDWVRALRGGTFGDAVFFLGSDRVGAQNPANKQHWSGFRVALVPEPTSLTLLAMGCVGLVTRRRSGAR